ncbi:MAG: hypothetical protein CSA72_11750 [Rhodobacterales bacterium]|nr:MAG: hypothetical protein CSA72_11750 [Rhodobacterales bacterium]
MTSPDLSCARDFVFTHGRLLDRLRFATLFDGAPATPVLTALEAYRADTGLFAHGLEPDKRSPAPQPMDQWEALMLWDELGPFPKLARDLCDRLGALTTAEGGLPFSHPSVNGAPHAAWWACDAPQPASINPTGSILACLWRAGVTHPWMKDAESFCWRALPHLAPDSVHSLGNARDFLSEAADRARADAAWPSLRHTIRAATAFDPDAEGYVFGPLDFAPTPQIAEPLYTFDEIAPHLEHLAAAQQEDGGWPVSWPTLSPVIEGEGRARRTIAALKVLHAYGIPT